jgi:hypothetical protein
MQVKSEKRIQLPEELRFIPKWAYGLAAVAFVVVEILFVTLLAHQKDAPPVPTLALLGLLAAAVVSCYLLLIGYINRDAGRRGMGRLLWTTIAVLIPNGFGIILYFVLRQPLLGRCPQCDSVVQSGFNYCPKCNHQLHPNCPHCQHAVQKSDVYCAYCGGALTGGGVQVSSSSPPTAAQS